MLITPVSHSTRYECLNMFMICFPMILRNFSQVIKVGGFCLCIKTILHIIEIPYNIFVISCFHSPTLYDVDGQSVMWVYMPTLAVEWMIWSTGTTLCMTLANLVLPFATPGYSLSDWGHAMWLSCRLYTLVLLVTLPHLPGIATPIKCDFAVTMLVIGLYYPSLG